MFADRGSMPLWEDAALNSGMVVIDCVRHVAG